MKFLTVFILSVFLSNSAFATCNFATDIKPQADGTYNYSKECHIAVGVMKQNLDVANKQVAKLTDAINLKDLALQKSDDRANLWRDISVSMDARVQAAQNLQSDNKWLYFGLGIVATGVVMYGASKIVGRR